MSQGKRGSNDSRCVKSLFLKKKKKKSLSSLFPKTTKVRQHEVILNPTSLQPGRLFLVLTIGVLISAPRLLSALPPTPRSGGWAAVKMKQKLSDLEKPRSKKAQLTSLTFVFVWCFGL